MSVNTEMTIQWNDRGLLTSIETPRLILRPIKEEDLPAYKKIFNQVSMSLYRGSFREDRFKTWLDRWNAHNFSALAIVNKTSEKAEVIGHAIFGHGDYEGTMQTGWSEIAFILHQSYWNAKYADPERDIGTKGCTGLGTEVVSALMQYAKEISEKGAPVPGDIDPDKFEEVKSKQLYYENGKLRAVYLPLTEVRASCGTANEASVRILQRAFKIKEGIGRQKVLGGNRPGYSFSIHTKDLR